MSKSASLSTAIATNALGDDAQTMEAASWLKAAEREAMPMLLKHGVMFDHGEADMTEIVELALVRIITANDRGNGPAADTRIHEAFEAEFKRTGSQTLSNDVIEQRLGFQRAAFYLGLAMGRILGGAR
jgi:hypothetical protein